MPVLRNIPLSFTADTILRIAQGARNPRRDASTRDDPLSGTSRSLPPEQRAAFHSVAEEMRDMAFDCALPAAAWERYALEGTDSGAGVATLLLPPLQDTEDVFQGNSSRIALFLGESVSYLEGAAYVFTAVTTIGAELEQRFRAFEAGGDLLRAYFLNAAGVLALESAATALRALVRERAIAEGHVLSPTLLPGSAPGWPVEGQETLLRLAGGNRLGIAITDGYMLHPLMSGSFALGVGDFPGRQHPATLCTGCERYETCLWRQIGDDAPERNGGKTHPGE